MLGYFNKDDQQSHCLFIQCVICIRILGNLYRGAVTVHFMSRRPVRFNQVAVDALKASVVSYIIPYTAGSKVT